MPKQKPAPTKFGGTLVHFARDRFGSIEIVEDFGVRTLHFGTPARQSSMCLREPDNVELPYVRAMLSALLFCPEPGAVLLLGLGGGSLAKALLRHLPGSRIDVVEQREIVVEAAHRFFGLPEDPRLSITVGDAAEFVGRARTETDLTYDLILADIFDGQGMAPLVTEDSFYRGCAGLLGAGGMFCTNLWGSQTAVCREVFDLLKMAFEGPALRLSVPGRGNLIAFASASEPDGADLREMERRARRLHAEFGIEFPQFLRALRQSNRALFG